MPSASEKPSSAQRHAAEVARRARFRDSGLRAGLSNQSHRIFVAAVILAPFILVSLPLFGSLGALDRTGDLRVAVVSLDEPQTTTSGETVDLGGALSRALGKRIDFAWQPAPADEARAGLADGTFVAILTVNAGFTRAVLESGAAPGVTYLDIQSRIDLPEIGQRVQESVSETYALTILGAAVDGVPGAASNGSPLVDLAAKTAEAGRSLDNLASSVEVLRSAVSRLGSRPKTLERDLNTAARAAREVESFAAAANQKVQSAATAANSLASTVASTRGLLVAEMSIQGLSSTQRSHILAVYDRLNPYVTSLRSTVSAAQVSAVAAQSSAANALRRVRALGSSESATDGQHEAFQAIDSVTGTAQAAAAAIADVNSSVRALSDLQGGADTRSLEPTSPTTGPDKSLGVETVLPAALFALSVGAILAAVATSRLGRPLPVSSQTGIPFVPHSGSLAVVSSAQGALVGAGLSLGLNPTPAGIVGLVAFSVIISLGFASAFHAAILWAGAAALGLVAGAACFGWSLLFISAPEGSLPTWLKLLEAAAPSSYALDALRSAAFGDPWVVPSHLVPPALVFLTLVVVSAVLAEMAINSKVSWAVRRLADAM